MRPSTVQFGYPSMEDGAEVYRLIKSCPPLDVNSQYCYHLICRDFRQTCVIARDSCPNQGQRVVGFLSAYVRPEQPECLFIWQIAVSEVLRGQQLASGMLSWLAATPMFQTITVVEATIAPSNHASKRFFYRFAATCNAVVKTFPFLATTQFSDESLHEDEVLHRMYLSDPVR